MSKINWNRVRLTELAPDGITGTQIQEIEDRLYDRIGGFDHGLKPGDWTPQERSLMDELHAASMMLSCLIYGHEYSNSGYQEDVILNLSRNGMSYTEATAEIHGLWNIQRRFFETSAHVKFGTKIDSEGCTYNSVDYDTQPVLAFDMDLGKRV